MVGVTAFASPNAPPLRGRFPADSRIGDVHFGHDFCRILNDLYDELRGDQEALSQGLFEKFLRQTQREKTVELEKRDYSFGEFLWIWVHNFSWDAVAPLPEKDVSKPLTNYFISSSHNTYLDGHQLLSRSTPQAYRNVLSKGGRCIEIDVWSGEPATPRSRSKSPAVQHLRQASGTSLTTAVDDIRETARKYFGSATHSRSASCTSATIVEDSPKSSLHAFQSAADKSDRLDPSQAASTRDRSSIPRGEPVVRHGPKLTARCGFRQVAEAIRDSAFVDNDLPIIISLEMHADLEQQEVMVKIMKEVWQDMLVETPNDGCDPRFRVPRLSELRRKILVKVKRPQVTISQPGKYHSAPTTQIEYGHENESPHHYSQQGKSMSNAATSAPPSPDPSSKVPIHDSLRALAVYTRSERFEGFDTPQAKRPTHIFSISESGILELDHKHHDVMFAHNKSFFMRSYPNVTRINSSNHDPVQFWRKGVQMVAMNWQYPDDGMMLNYGMFADERGWVLKPPGYQSSDKFSQNQYDAATAHKMNLTLTIFKGQNIPVHGSEEDIEHNRKSLHSVTRVEIHTGRSHGSNRESKTSDTASAKKTTVRKSFNPVYGPTGETLTFHDIPNVVEELSFLLYV